MREFNLQEAKAGKPVCTRDGKNARIICFDKKGPEYPIVALVSETDDVEEMYNYSIDGKFYNSDINHTADLFMAPEKKTGWINIYEFDGDQRNCYGIYHTIDEAIAADDNTTGGRRITTIQIEWEE